jgi:CheY-like chemotaxis protein
MSAKTILLADDDAALCKALAIRCAELGLEALTCFDGVTAHRTIVFEEIARNSKLPPIPAIILTGKSDEATIQECARLGVQYVWKGLDTWNDLKPLICRLLDLEVPASVFRPAPAAAAGDPSVPAAAPDRSAPKVLVVDDDPDIAKALKIKLRHHGIDVVQAYSGMQGYWAALQEQPDVVVMDYCMPEGYGNVLLGKLRTHSLTKHIPAIVLTGRCIGGNRDYALERELLSLGATAFLTKPLDFDALLTELRIHIKVAKKDTPRALQTTRW